MKTQITSILLCALLSSTLAHEYLSARHSVHEARSSKYLSHFQAREALSTPQQCTWTCDGNSNSNITGGLQIIVRESVGLIAILNVTAGVALTIDINANLVAIGDGTGAVIVVNIQTGAGVYIAAGQSTSVWISSKESFESYISKLTSLQALLDLKVGISFTTTSITSAVLKILGNLLGQLSNVLKLQIEGDIKASLTILLKISSSLVTVLKGSLDGILKLFGKGLIAIHGDIVWLVHVLEGLGAFFAEVTGGLAALIKAKVEFDLAVILGAANGIDLLVNLLLAIVARVDLSIVGSLLNSAEKLLALIVKLGGNVSGGLTGLFKVVAHIVGLLNGHVSIDVLIRTLLEFAASNSIGIDIKISLEGLLKVIEIQSSSHSTDGLAAFITFVNNLLSGKLVIGGINISEIIEILIKGVVGGALKLVVTVLLRLSAVTKAAVAIPTLLFNLLQLLNSTAGIHLLEEVVPGLSIDVNISIGGNIVGQILGKVNIKTIIALLTKGGGIEVVLKALPVVGPIVDALSGAVSASSNGSLNLSVLLKSSGEVVANITAWVKSSLKISGGITLPTLPTLGDIFGNSGGSNGSAGGSGSLQWGAGGTSSSNGSAGGSGSLEGGTGGSSSSNGSAGGSGSLEGGTGGSSSSNGSAGGSGSLEGGTGGSSNSNGSAGGSGSLQGGTGGSSSSNGSAGGSGSLQGGIGGSSSSNGSAGGSGSLQWGTGGSSSSHGSAGGSAHGSAGGSAHGSAGGSGSFHWG